MGLSIDPIGRLSDFHHHRLCFDSKDERANVVSHTRRPRLLPIEQHLRLLFFLGGRGDGEGVRLKWVLCHRAYWPLLTCVFLPFAFISFLILQGEFVGSGNIKGRSVCLNIPYGRYSERTFSALFLFFSLFFIPFAFHCFTLLATICYHTHTHTHT